jgi:hypothetical protein
MRHILRTTVIYLALVTPPLVGLVGILEVGKGIAAPRSFGGEWQLDDASRREAGEPCHGLVFDKQATLKVSQSGLRGEVTFADKAKTVLDVHIDDTRISGSGRASSDGDCDQPLSLDARLEKNGPRAEIVGTLERRGCSGCPVAHVRAGKKPPAANP